MSGPLGWIFLTHTVDLNTDSWFRVDTHACCRQLQWLFSRCKRIYCCTPRAAI